jgi:hypothetical protein
VAGFEEVYVLAEETREAYSAAFLNGLASQGSKKEREPSLVDPKWPRMRMLVHLYLPELMESFSAVESSGMKYFEAYGKMLMAKPTTAGELREAINDFHREHRAAEATLDQFVKALTSLSSSVTAKAVRSYSDV